MGLLAQPWVVKTRNRVRHLGFAQALYQRWKSTFDYEERFGRELIDNIDSQSVVWDVGANVGLYTQKFIDKGARKVVCVEPAPMAVAALQARFAGLPAVEERVIILPMALSDTAGTARMSANGASPTNRLSPGAASPVAPAADSIVVEVNRADEVIARQKLPPPNVLKIDVEGFELEALRGFGDCIHSQQLRAVFIEMHFSLLHERGLDRAPDEISRMLKKAGFTVRWLDFEHVCGLRA
jgi:FkbM family methyltransferase